MTIVRMTLMDMRGGEGPEEEYAQDRLDIILIVASQAGGGQGVGKREANQ